MQVRKQDIYQIPINDWADLSLQELEVQVRQENLQRLSTWLLPQLVAHFGRWTLASSIRETVEINTNSKQLRVLYHLAMISRSALLQKQIAQPEYAQLTPLILLGFRQNHGVLYEHWRTQKDLQWILEPKLYEALVNVSTPLLSKNRLLELQQQALTIKTSQNSSRVGTLRTASSWYKLSGLKGTELESLPLLHQHLLLQTWLAHPQHRRPGMILDPNNWDLIPPALIDWNPLFREESQPPPWALV
jgi:hypothetical protein